MVSAVIVAGGVGTRMGADKNKILLQLSDRPVIAHTIDAFAKCTDIDELVLVCRKCDADEMMSIIDNAWITKPIKITEGGNTRQESVFNGLACADGDVAIIHDGARCLITPDAISAVVRDVYAYGAAAMGVRVKDTLKTIDSDMNIIGTVDREYTVQIQTPQGFKTSELIDLHKRAVADKLSVTDDSAIFEHYGKTVHFTPGSYDNIKLTTPEDMAIGEKVLNDRRAEI